MRFTSILQTLLAVLVSAAPAFAWDGQPPGQFVFMEDFTLQSGQTVDGDLVVFGGDVRLEADSRVDGSLVAWGGDVEIAGTVEEDVVAWGSDVLLRETARIDGRLIVFSGEVEREQGAQVAGQQIMGPSLWFRRYWRWRIFPLLVYPISLDEPLMLALGGLVVLLRAVAMAGLGGLVALLWPGAAARVGRGVLERPLVTFGMGLLTLVIGLSLAIGLIITLCFSPMGVAVVIALAVAILFGWLAIGIVIGERLMPMLTTRTVAPFWTAALGAGFLTLLSDLLALVPWVGWVGGLLVACAGLGSVALTRFRM